MTKIEGHCAPEFAAVETAFSENFKTRGDIGAAVSVYAGTECLIDLWGGYQDAEETAPWQRDTKVNIWSTTKGITAVCFAMAVERGVLSYDDKVATYWPEFAVGGKQDITISMLLSHQAGLCGFREPATIKDYYDIESAASRLAAAEPFWSPGSQSGYHAISIGALASALFRRAEGRYIREFVDAELRQKCGLDIHIGLPENHSHECAELLAPSGLDSEATAPVLNEAQIAALANPPMDAMVANTSPWRSAEIPSANGHATARALARLYAAIGAENPIEGHTLISRKTLQRASDMQIEGVDAVLGVPARWANGFLLNTDGLYGPNAGTFGHSGWGGSFAFADPVSGIAVAYTMNRMGTDLVGDPRNKALIDSIYTSL